MNLILKSSFIVSSKKSLSNDYCWSIEEIALFNTQSTVSIKKEKFNDTVETYDEEEEQKYISEAFAGTN